jgi:hypothetical protein
MPARCDRQGKRGSPRVDGAAENFATLRLRRRCVLPHVRGPPSAAIASTIGKPREPETHRFEVVGARCWPRHAAPFL